MATLSEPCSYPRALRGQHKLNPKGSICMKCGARAEDAPDPTPFMRYQAAEVEYRKASEALDETFSTGFDAAEKFNRTVRWRQALASLREAEGTIG